MLKLLLAAGFLSTVVVPSVMAQSEEGPSHYVIASGSASKPDADPNVDAFKALLQELERKNKKNRVDEDALSGLMVDSRVDGFQVIPPANKADKRLSSILQLLYLSELAVPFGGGFSAQNVRLQVGSYTIAKRELLYNPDDICAFGVRTFLDRKSLQTEWDGEPKVGVIVGEEIHYSFRHFSESVLQSREEIWVEGHPLFVVTLGTDGYDLEKQRYRHKYIQLKSGDAENEIVRVETKADGSRLDVTDSLLHSTVDEFAINVADKPLAIHLIKQLLSDCSTKNGGSTNSEPRPLSDELVSMFVNRLRECWIVPPGGRESGFKIRMSLSFNLDGSLATSPKILNPKKDKRFIKLANSATDAVLHCQNYDFLPVDRYDDWKEMKLTFDPNMFGN